MAKTYGIDVSHWEGVIYWSLVASSGVNFVIMKATDGWIQDGQMFIDHEFAANKAGCIANGLPWGAYHYYQPAVDPIDQADHFVKTVGAGCHRYFVDVEEDYGTGDNWSALLKEFLDRVEELTGKKPTIYTSPGFWNTYLLPVPSWTPNYDLWVAHWGVTVPTLPNGWSTYVIHQISATGTIPGINTLCDEDWFNGDLQAVWNYFGYAEVEPTSFKIMVVGSYKGAVILDSVELPRKKIGMAFGESEWTATAKVKASTGGNYYRIGERAYIPAWLCEEV